MDYLSLVSSKMSIIIGLDQQALIQKINDIDFVLQKLRNLKSHYGVDLKILQKQIEVAVNKECDRFCASYGFHGVINMKKENFVINNRKYNVVYRNFKKFTIITHEREYNRRSGIKLYYYGKNQFSLAHKYRMDVEYLKIFNEDFPQIKAYTEVVKKLRKFRTLRTNEYLNHDLLNVRKVLLTILCGWRKSDLNCLKKDLIIHICKLVWKTSVPYIDMIEYLKTSDSAQNSPRDSGYSSPHLETQEGCELRYLNIVGEALVTPTTSNPPYYNQSIPISRSNSDNEGSQPTSRRGSIARAPSQDNHFVRPLNEADFVDQVNEYPANEAEAALELFKLDPNVE